MSPRKYDNQVGPYNAYGRCLELLARNVGQSSGIHLDLACGLAPIADSISQIADMHYIGIDFDEASVTEVRGRGFEAHVLDLNSVDCEQDLRALLDGRKLASVSMLDGLEHLVAGRHILQALSSLLAEHKTICIFSVPNVTHADVSIKALLGKWTYTTSGLLDETHYRLFSEESLDQALRESGLVRVDEANVVMVESDQHFPSDHGALSRTTPLGQFLRWLRASIDDHGSTNQFVWAVAPVPVKPVLHETSHEPFLSVIMRTQGRRIQELREVLLCLASQSETDFELLLTAHRVDQSTQVEIERLIEDQPAGLRGRIRLLLLDTGGRAAPLNHALRQARGRYSIILDDDDLVFEHWVATFRHHEQQRLGRIIRTLAVAQRVELGQVLGLNSVRGVASPEMPYSTHFSLSQHLSTNQSPAHTWAFPRTVYRDFAMRFDETMTTTEDWEFLLRAAEVVGVTDVTDVTATYQWWTRDASSRTAHSEDEWRQNHTEVQRRMDSRPLLLPAGETRIVREKLRRLDEVEHLFAHVHSGEGTVGQLQQQVRLKEHELVLVRQQLAQSNHRQAVLRKRVKNLRMRQDSPRRSRDKSPAEQSINTRAVSEVDVSPATPSWRRRVRNLGRMVRS